MAYMKYLAQTAREAAQDAESIAFAKAFGIEPTLYNINAYLTSIAPAIIEPGCIVNLNINVSASAPNRSHKICKRKLRSGGPDTEIMLPKGLMTA